MLFIGILTVISFLSISKKNSPDSTEKITISNYNPDEYTPEELKKIIEGDDKKYVVIDVRTQQEYDFGHVPGALRADYHNKESLTKAATGKIPITYDGFSTMRGPYAAYLLYQNGHSRVGILLGGLAAWAEDIGKMETKSGAKGDVFLHPKNIFPERKKQVYPPGQGTAEFTIEAKKFTFTPNTIKVKHGQEVIIHLKSTDAIHGFSLPEYEIEEELLPNIQKTVSFTADRKGNFSFITNVVSGKDYASMVGNIIVR